MRGPGVDARSDGKGASLAKRSATSLRPVEIQVGFTAVRGGSVMIATGQTRVLCTAMVEEAVPAFREPSGGGWLTAEYRMLPSSTPQRRPREAGGKLDGRSTEIQRLIGRCLRAVVDFDALGPRTIHVDCDVLQADGGTRTAAVTGAYVAVREAVRNAMEHNLIERDPITGMLAGVSVGIVEGKPVLDLDYKQDSGAEVDFNVVMTDRDEFVEVQGSAEGKPFSTAQLDRMLELARKGIRQLFTHQRRALTGT